jgi:hypothetical protein
VQALQEPNAGNIRRPWRFSGLSKNLKNVCVQAVIIRKEWAVVTTRRGGNLLIDATHCHRHVSESQHGVWPALMAVPRHGEPVCAPVDYRRRLLARVAAGASARLFR